MDVVGLDESFKKFIPWKLITVDGLPGSNSYGFSYELSREMRRRGLECYLEQSTHKTLDYESLVRSGSSPHSALGRCVVDYTERFNKSILPKMREGITVISHDTALRSLIQCSADLLQIPGVKDNHEFELPCPQGEVVSFFTVCSAETALKNSRKWRISPPSSEELQNFQFFRKALDAFIGRRREGCWVIEYNEDASYMAKEAMDALQKRLENGL